MSTPNVPLQTQRLILAYVQKAIYNWVRLQVAGVIPDSQILWRNQSEPLPPRPCVTMKVIDGPRRTGYNDHVLYSGTGTKFFVGGQRIMTVSIQVFGNTKVLRPMAYQLAFDLNSSLSLPSVLDLLRSSNVGVLQQGEPTNLTALEETEYEERAGFDVLFSLAQNILDDPSAIEHVGPIGKTISPPQ
jgi:hypothetical protein